jgi:outer membrane protein W
MRRIVVLAAVMVLMATVVNAQDYLKSGQWVLSGATAATFNRQTFTAKSDTTSSETNTSTQIDFSGTYFFSKSIGIGVMLAAQNTSVSASGTSSSDKTTLTTYGVGPVLVMRFGSGRMTFNIRGGVGLGKNSVKTGSEAAADTDVKYFMGGGGLSYHINEVASFDVAVRYQKSTVKDPKDTDPKAGMDVSGLIFGVGFGIYFGGR